MPHHRRPIRPLRIAPPVPVKPRHSPLAPTILPTTFTQVTRPPKLPPRPISGHPLGTILTVPTVGPLPPPPMPTVVNDPTIVLPPRIMRRPPPVILRQPNAGVPFIPGVPLARAPIGRFPVRRF